MPPGIFHLPRRHTSEQVDVLFARQRAGDRLGYRIHLFLALGACFLAGWSTTFTEWAALPVLICFLVRMTGWHGLLEPLGYDRVLRLLLAWGAWVGLSVLWSAARLHPGPGMSGHEWVRDVQSLRFLALPVILWPVMDRRSWLVAALVTGIACGQLSQFVHLAGVALHATWTPWQRMPGRITGWWDPVVGGSILCAGLGLWLSAAMFASRVRARWIGTAGSLATLVCVALTGTRGAWIGAALLVLVGGAIGLWRLRPRRNVLWPWGATLVAAALIGAAGWMILVQPRDPARPDIAMRLKQGVEEVRSAFGPRGYESDTGLRIAMWRWGVAAFRTHPVLGVGGGGFQPWVRAQNDEAAARLGAPAGAIPLVHAHAHSWFIHTLATLGIVGFAILIALVFSAIVSGLHGVTPFPSDLPSHLSPAAAALSAFTLGPPLALIGLACAGLFDSITVNQQTAYLFYLLIAFCLPTRPHEHGRAGAPGASS